MGRNDIIRLFFLLSFILPGLLLPVDPQEFLKAGPVRESAGMAGIAPIATTQDWPEDLLGAVSEVLRQRPRHVLPGSDANLILTSLDFLSDGTSVMATAVMRPDRPPDPAVSLLRYPGILVTARRQGSEWRAGLWETSDLSRLSTRSHGSLREGSGPGGQNRNVQSPSSKAADATWKLPWRDGQSWFFTNGPFVPGAGSPVASALDFAPSPLLLERDREVRAAFAGTVVRKCTDALQTEVLIADASGSALEYAHLEKNSAMDLIAGTTTVRQGEPLGVVLNRRGFNGTCGAVSSAHLTVSPGSWSGGTFQPQSAVGAQFSGWTLGSAGCFTSGGNSRCLGDSLLSDNSPPQLTLGVAANGEINPAGDQDFHFFSGNQGDAVTITFNRTSGTLDPFLMLYGPDETLFYTDDDGGAFAPNARLVRQLPQTGRYRIVARAQTATQTGGYALAVSSGTSGIDPDDGRWLASKVSLGGTISSTTDADGYYFYGTTGSIVSITMRRTGITLDSFLELYDPNGTYLNSNNDGGGADSGDAWLTHLLSSSGTFRVNARSYNQSSYGGYTIRVTLMKPTNYAAGKSASASSADNSLVAPYKAIDDDLTSRWASLPQDPQWLQVDLLQAQSIDSAVLHWAENYGKRYFLQFWENDAWKNLVYIPGGNGGTERLGFPMTTARYVRIYVEESVRQSGCSLWEFQVYNSTLAVMPTVPPDTAPPDNKGHTAPLPLAENDKSSILALYVYDGAGAQELVPLPGDDEGIMPLGTLGNEGIPTASIDMILSGYPGSGLRIPYSSMLSFRGSAFDNDSDGQAGIVAYEWASNRDGILSTSASFSRNMASLKPGQHTISFRARNNEDIWSEPELLPWTIVSYLFLPLVMR